VASITALQSVLVNNYRLKAGGLCRPLKTDVQRIDKAHCFDGSTAAYISVVQAERLVVRAQPLSVWLFSRSTDLLGPVFVTG
jgi:hypothetical protein